MIDGIWQQAADYFKKSNFLKIDKKKNLVKQSIFNFGVEIVEGPFDLVQHDKTIENLENACKSLSVKDLTPLTITSLPPSILPGFDNHQLSTTTATSKEQKSNPHQNMNSSDSNRIRRKRQAYSN